jgi:hypothetical protein
MTSDGSDRPKVKSKDETRTIKEGGDKAPAQPQPKK